VSGFDQWRHSGRSAGLDLGSPTLCSGSVDLQRQLPAACRQRQNGAVSLGRRIRSLVLVAVVVPILVQRSIDLATIVVGVAVLAGALLYGLAPLPIDPETGRSLPDRAVIPEILRARRTRRSLRR
jgi:hypothetical protein